MEGAFGPGRVLLGKYRIDGVLGRGGMGVVLQVTHLQLGEQLALKVLSSEGVATPELHARFLREAQAVVRLRGEHVARVSDVGVLPDGTPYMVMEYLRGLDLAAELERRGRLFPGEAVDYVLQACEALAEAHAHGVVHRDIKPANLFLTTRPDGTPLVKLLDFGISKAPVTEATQLTKTDAVMGTCGYMSPEQMRASRDVDPRSDIWALGIVLYECLNGRRPFGGESFLAVAMMAGTEPPPAMEAWVSRPLQGVVLRCLQKDRGDRYASVSALASALAPFARDQRTAAVVVERANLMRQGLAPDGGVELAARAGRSESATTLSGSARALRARPPIRRRTVAGVFALLGSIALLSLAGLLVTGRLSGGSAPSYTDPDSPDAGPPEGEPASQSASKPAEGVAAGAAGPASPASPASDDGARSLARCAELTAQRRWREVKDCAARLDALGLPRQATEFQDKAVRETRNEAGDGNVRVLLRDGMLRQAQAQLSQVSRDSVYREALEAAFDRADAANVDEVTRRSQAFVAAHDCAGLARYVAQQSTSDAGTRGAIAAARAASARCGQRGQRAPTAPATTAAGGALAPTAPGSASPAAGKVSCDTLNVDDTVAQAATQYSSGHASSALGLIVKALGCKQTVRMYRLAAFYGCGAHDLATARAYFVKLPADQQAAIEQRCQQEGLNLRGP